MRTLALTVTIVAATAVAAATYTPPNVMLGLWETTASRNQQGPPPIPEGMLSRMTPEQRSRIEARMRARSGASQSNETWRSCLTQKDLNDWRLFKKDDMQCTQSLDNEQQTASGTELDGHWQCSFREGYTGTGTVHFVVLSPTTTQGKMHMNIQANGRQMTSDETFSSKWISSDCGEIK
jgi:Protein of unknown function (DUF3617)